MTDSMLKQKAIKGSFWSLADSVLGQGVTFLIGLVLARMLSPDEYGLIGIITIFTTIFVSLSDCGFTSALIRKKECSQRDYDTMFLINLLVSLVLMSVLMLGAGVIADFFQREELVDLTRAASVIVVIQALSATQMVALSRRLDFKLKTKASLVSAFLSGLIGIWMAYHGYGVWSLLWQLISKQTIYTLSLWLLNRWYPTFRFSRESLGYMWGFGWKLTFSTILANFENQVYKTMMGGCYSSAILGQYTNAKQYVDVFCSGITRIVQRVSYPALSKLQDDNERLTAIYRKVLRVTMFISVVPMLLLAGLSRPLVLTLVGERWSMAADFLPFLAFGNSFYCLSTLNIILLQVMGRSDCVLRIQMVKMSLVVIPILVGSFLSIWWMIGSMVFISLISVRINTYYTEQLLGYRLKYQLKDIVPSYIVGFVLFLSIWFFQYLPIACYQQLIIQFMVAIIVFFAYVHFVPMEEYRILSSIIKTLVRRLFRLSGSKPL